MKILRKSKEKIQRSLYPIHMLLELFSLCSLPSLCCKIELTCLSLSSAGHLAVCPHSAANGGGSERRADEAVAAGALLALGTPSRARSAAHSVGLSLGAETGHPMCAR